MPNVTPALIKSPPQESWDDSMQFRWMRDLSTRLVFGVFTLSAGAIAANTTVDTTVLSTASGDLTGLRAGHAIVLLPPSTLTSGIVVGGAWAGSNQITVRLGNITTGALTPPSATWSFWAFLTTGAQ